MNCQQFQEVLPYIIESGGKAEEETHLQQCPACAELVEELRYIADQAKLLLPLHDPNPRVWTNIEQSLQRGPVLGGSNVPPGTYNEKPDTSEKLDPSRMGDGPYGGDSLCRCAYQLSAKTVASGAVDGAE